MFWGTNSSRGSFDIAASTLSSWMPRGLSCSSTIFCRSAANSGLEVTFWWQPLVTRSATTRDCETRLIINITQQTGVSAATNYSCPSCSSWLISPAFHERAFVIPSEYASPARTEESLTISVNEDRKTPEMRGQMTDIERLRHSASHVLATAILKIWPEAQFAAGPPVENGFYYDVDLPHRISPEDFEKIEAEMKKEIKANHPFEKMEVSRDEALDLGKKGRLAALGDRKEPSKFKIDIIEGIPPGEKISLYRT